MFSLEMLACRSCGHCLALATPKCRPRRALSEGITFSTIFVLQSWCFICSCHVFLLFAGGASAATSSGGCPVHGPSPAQGPSLEQGQSSTSESEEESKEEKEKKDDEEEMEEVKVEEPAVGPEPPVPSEETEWESFEEEEEGVNETPQPPKGPPPKKEEPEVEEVPVLPKDRHCLQSKAKAKPGERKTPVDAQEGGEKEEDWEIAEGKKKEEEKEEGKEVAFRASSFKSGQADPLEEEEKASLAASEALALNKGQGEPEKICNQKILTKKDLPPKKIFEPKKIKLCFHHVFFQQVHLQLGLWGLP